MINDVVEVSVMIAAKTATVYSFLIEPSQFARWMGPGSAITTAQSGDSFRIQYQNGDVAAGQILERVENCRVVYSWGYENTKLGPPPGSTRVTFDLLEVEGGTRLTVRHEGFTDPTQCANHEQGWRYHAGRLMVLAIQAEVTGVLPSLLDAYTRGWNETDPAARGQALQASWEETGVYRDQLSRTDGREALAAYIQGVQTFAPGLRLQITGQPRQCQEHVSFDWKILNADGQSFGTGTCFGQVSGHGRFSSVVSFWGGAESA